MKNTISAVGCFAVIYSYSQDSYLYRIVLVRRKDGGYLELPGGGLDYSLDITPNTDPFIKCVIREVEEESGISLDENKLFNRGILVQRILMGTDCYGIGTVHLYSHNCPELDDDSFKKALEGFTSDESSEVVIVDFNDGFFERKDISLAAKRMIAIALSGVEVGGNTQITFSALSSPVFVGRLGVAVFKTTV